MHLDTLIRCWRQTPGDHRFHPAATAAQITLAEEKLSLTLPHALRQLYEFSNGISLFQGNLRLYPLHEEKSELCLTRVTPWLRLSHWPIPPGSSSSAPPERENPSASGSDPGPVPSPCRWS